MSDALEDAAAIAAVPNDELEAALSILREGGIRAERARSGLADLLLGAASPTPRQVEVASAVGMAVGVVLGHGGLARHLRGLATVRDDWPTFVALSGSLGASVVAETLVEAVVKADAPEPGGMEGA